MVEGSVRFGGDWRRAIAKSHCEGDHVLELDLAMAILVENGLHESPCGQEAVDKARQAAASNLIDVIKNAPTPNTYRFKLRPTIGSLNHSANDIPPIGRLLGVILPRGANRPPGGYQFYEQLVTKPRCVKDPLFEYSGYQDIDMTISTSSPMLSHYSSTNDPTSPQYLSRGDVKNLYTRVIFTGTWEGWMKDLVDGDPTKPSHLLVVRKTLRDPIAPEDFMRYQEEMRAVTNAILEQNEDFCWIVRNCALGKKPSLTERELNKKCIAMYLQTIECAIMTRALGRLIKRKRVAAKTSDYAHDGCTVKALGAPISEIDIADVNEFVRKETGFLRTTFVLKAFELSAADRALIERRQAMNEEEVAAVIAGRNPPVPPPVEVAPPTSEDNAELMTMEMKMKRMTATHNDQFVAMGMAKEEAVRIWNEHVVKEGKEFFKRDPDLECELKQHNGGGVAIMKKGEAYIDKMYAGNVMPNVVKQVCVRYAYTKKVEGQRGEAVQEVSREESMNVTDFIFKDDSINVLQKITYKPYTLCDPEYEPSKNVYNAFIPMMYDRAAMTHRPTVEHIKKLRMFLLLTYVLVGGEWPSFIWMVKFLAHIVQFPNDTPAVLVSMYSTEGAGKDTWIHIFMNAIGRHHGQSDTKMEHVTGKFNSSIAKKLVYVISESKAADVSGNNWEVLKGISTESTVTIECKGVDAVEVPNKLRLFQMTNHQQYLDNLNERRRIMFECLSTLVKNKAFFSLADSLSIDEDFLITLIWFLQRVDLDDWNPIDFQRTVYMNRCYRASKTLFPMWLRIFIEHIRPTKPLEGKNLFFLQVKVETKCTANQQTFYSVPIKELYTSWTQFRTEYGYEKMYPLDRRQFTEAFGKLHCEAQQTGGQPTLAIWLDTFVERVDKAYPPEVDLEEREDVAHEVPTLASLMWMPDVEEQDEDVQQTLGNLTASLPQRWDHEDWTFARTNNRRKRKRENDRVDE